MAHTAIDRVMELSTTVGTGAFTLLGPVANYKGWVAAVGNGNSAYYAAVGTTDFEVGVGTVTAGTLTRDTILASSNNNLAVNFPAGSKQVFLDYPAARSVYILPNGKVNVDASYLSGTMAQFDTALSDGDFVYQNQNANLGQISTGAGVSTGDARIELGGLRTGDGNSYIDFHSVSGSDNDARIIRGAGANGGFDISNTGTGTLSLSQNNTGPIVFNTTAAERVRVTSAGRVGVGITAPVSNLHVAGTDGQLQFGISAATKGIRFIVGAGGSTIDGVDNSLVASFQPLQLNGSMVSLMSNGGERLRVSNGAVEVWPGLTNYSGYQSLTAAAGVTRGTWLQTSGVDRWVVGANTAAESGGNVGSDYFINRYADNGGFLGTAVNITRATGDTYFNGGGVWLNNNLLLQHAVGGYSYIRSYAGRLYLGFNNTNNVYIDGNGLTVTQGQGVFTQTGNQILLKNGYGSSVTSMFRNDGANFYILLSDNTIDPTNTWNGLRPFAINLANGSVSMANGLTVNGGFTSGSTSVINGDLYTGDQIHVRDTDNNHYNSIQYKSQDGGTNYGIVGFEGSNDLRLWSNTGWVRSVSNFVAAYVQSDGGGYFTGNLATANQFNCADGVASGWWRNTGATGLYNNTYGRGITVADTYVSYGNMVVYGSGLNGWQGISFSNNNKVNMMTDGGTIGLYNATTPNWLWSTDMSGNFVANGNVAAFSDLRLKENVREIDNVVARRDTLAQAAIKYERDGRTRIGYGAQTLRDNGCAEFVLEAEDAMKIATGLGTLSVDYGETTAILAVMSKRADDTIAALEARIERLEAIIKGLT